MKRKIGDKVYLKQSYAKWHLNNPEIYSRPNGTLDDCYETETIMHLMVCMGISIEGKITGFGNDCYKVVFKEGRLKMWYYCDGKNLTSRKE